MARQPQVPRRSEQGSQALDEDFAIMDIANADKEQEIGPHETGTQTEWGRCQRRKYLKKQRLQRDAESDCEFGPRHERKLMKKRAKKWMKKMLWRKMMIRMCYGAPGMGFGLGCRGRRMMAAMMETSNSESGDESGDRTPRHGGRWGRRCHKRFRRCGRRSGDELDDKTPREDKQQTEASKEQGDGNMEVLEVGLENETETAAAPAPKVSSEKDDNRRRKDHKKKGKHHVHFGHTTSESSSSTSSSSSSESSSEEEDYRRHGRCHRYRRWGGPRSNEAVSHPRGAKKDDDKVSKQKPWKGQGHHKKMMKKMNKRGYFKRFY